MHWWRRAKQDNDLDRELRSHLDLEAEEATESGASPEEARFAARRLFGNVTRVKESVRETSPWTRWDVLAKDILYAARSIRKGPAFAAVAIITLALGIGANTAIFSVLDNVLLRPLPYPESDRLVRLLQSQPGMGVGRLGTAPPEFVAYRDRTRAFSGVAGYQTDAFDLTGGSQPEQIAACQATASLFSVLRVEPLLGRTFTAKDELSGAARVVVLSYGFWQRRYGANPRVLGTALTLNEQSYRIIGVMPRSFTFPATATTPGEPPTAWTPLSFTPHELGDWASSFDTGVVARLKDGVSLAQAKDDARRVAKQFQAEHPDIYSGNVRLDAFLEPWTGELDQRVPLALSMLSAAVGFVLLIACANVANLMLARAAVRQRELSIRRALGAGQMRLMRQVLIESALIAAAGAALGCALAQGLVRIIAALWTHEVNLQTAHVDLRVLLFTLALSSVTCLLCAFVPAWRARKPNLNDTLKQSARQAGSSRQHRRLPRLLVVAEAACSAVLLTGAGLLLHSFVRVLQVSPGFNPERALIVRTTFNRQRYAEPSQRHGAQRAIFAKLAALPGVEAVALTTHIPLADSRQIGVLLDGHDPGDVHWTDNALITGDYFRVMGIPILRGRTFSEIDSSRTPPVAIVNETMARQFWPKQNPVGRGFWWGGRHLMVVGICGDVRLEALDKAVAPTVYNPVYQIESGATTSGVYVIRTATEDPMQLAAAARNAIWSVDHGLPIVGITTLHQVIAGSLAIRRASLLLVASFAALALILSLVGVYGVLSYAVTQRTQEMGVRLALGARPGELIRLVAGEGLRLTGVGLLLGVIAGAPASNLVSKLLFHVRPLDPMAFTGAILLLLAVSLVASYIPARRASRIDPIVALRDE